MPTLTITTSGLTDTQQIDANDALVPINQLRTYLQDFVNGAQQFDAIAFEDGQSLTIASGAITGLTRAQVIVDTEAAAATDDLDTIGVPTSGWLLFLRIANAGRTVRLRNNGGGSGNIRTAFGADILLTSTNQEALLIYDALLTVWNVIVVAGAANLGVDTTLTIASGVVTRTRIRHTIAAETGTADNLDTINGGSEGDVLELVADAGDTITLTASGNLRLHQSVVRNLDVTHPTVLRHDGTNWVESLQSIELRTPLNSTLETPTVLRVPDRSIINDSVTNQRRLAVLPAMEASDIILLTAAAATLSTFGCALPTIANAPANANDSDGAQITLPSTASGGNLAGFISTTFDLTRRQYNPVVTWIVKTSADISALRFWLLLTSAAITNVDTIAGATEVAGFRFSTVAPDTGWTPIVKDATTQAAGTTIGTVTTAQLWLLRMRIDSGAGIAYFTAKNTFSGSWLAEQTLSANLPQAATDLGFCVRVIPTGASIRTLNFLRMEVTSQ